MKSESVFLILALCAAAGACLPSPWAIPGTLLCIGLLLYLGLCALRDSCTDTLTGLQNLRGLQQMLHHTRSPDLPVSLLYIDLNDLHGLNLRFGHEAGDRALIALSAALTAIPSATAFRIGGDEFLLLSKSLSACQLLSLWQRRPEALRASAGVSSGPVRLFYSLMRQAEEDMYLNKGNNQISHNIQISV